MIARYQFHRAQKLELKGKTGSALDLYFKVLADVPSKDQKWRSQVLFRVGECLWRQGHVSEAVSAFQKSAAADESNVIAHLRLGAIYLAGGAADRASEQAQKVLELASTSPEGLALLGAASSAAGDTALAQKSFERVLQSEPKRVAVAVALADLYNRNDEVDKARQVLRNAIAAQPTSGLPWLALGRLEEQEGKPVAAEDAYRNAVSADDTVETNLRLARFLTRASRPDEASKVLTHADMLNHELPVAHADFKLLTGNPADALDRYSEMLRSSRYERIPPQSFWTRFLGHVFPRTGEARARLAVRLIESDLEIAADAATRDPSMIPATGAARLHLAAYGNDLDQGTAKILETEIALAEGDLNTAAAYAKGAVTVAPDSAPAHYIRGVVQYRKGDAASAKGEWLKALDQDQSFAPAMLALARDAFESHDYSGAEQYIIPVVRDEPEDVQALNLFSRIFYAQKRYRSAELIARRSTAINSNEAEPHILLADIAVAQDRFAAALGEYEQAITLNPRSQEAMNGLLRVYARGRVKKPMLAKLEQVAEMPPASASLMEISGRMYAQNGYRKDADRCFRRALAIDPYRVTAASALAKSDASHGDEQDALTMGARNGGPDAALLRALRAERQHDVGAAIREYESAVRQGEQSGIAANNLAWILAERRENLDHALRMAEKARALAPDNPSVLDTLGFVYLQRRDFSSAIPVLKEAGELAKRKRMKAEQPTIRKHLEQAYFGSGQRIEARR